jgi:hypothetical protein
MTDLIILLHTLKTILVSERSEINKARFAIA